MSKIINDEIIKNVRIRKILKVFLIIFSISTIVLAILSLTIKLNPVFCIISFIIEIIIKYIREKKSIK